MYFELYSKQRNEMHAFIQQNTQNSKFMYHKAIYAKLKDIFQLGPTSDINIHQISKIPKYMHKHLH